VKTPDDIPVKGATRKPGLVGLSSEWVTRPFFGIVLALGALAAIFAGTASVAAMAAVAACFGVREWFRMIGGGKYALSQLVSSAAIGVALALFMLTNHTAQPLIVLMGGAVAVLLLEAVTRGRPLWGAGGVFYLGLPALALVTLRDVEPRGGWLIVSLFITVWATDTGAFVVGNLVGGPKLWPKLSPNKTWSGLFGGILAAAAVEIVFALIVGCAFWATALLGAALAVAAHIGDLFESFVKRRFHLKDSGTLIPGHGGILDRIDSTLAAALALAVLVFAFHFDPLFGVRP
jgi:phosphatidate cytidylyltransferase